MHPLCRFGVLVEDSADPFKLTRMDVVVERWDEYELVRLDPTHRRTTYRTRDLRFSVPGQLLL